MIVCKECGYECSAPNALGYHLRTHNMSYESYVIKHDHASIQPTCKCGIVLRIKKGGFSKFCSKSCASSGEDNAMGRLKGEKSPNFGQRRTPEQRLNYSEGAKKRWDVHGDKLREMMKTPEYRRVNSDSQRQTYIRNPALRQRKTEDNHKFWSSDSDLTKQRRKEASIRAVQLLSENKIGPHAPFKTEHKFNPFTCNEEYMHSSWESIFLDACVARNYPVTKDHGIEIEYVQSDGSLHLYIPDFYGFEDRTLYEVKGRHDAIDDAKWLATKEWCKKNSMQFIVLFEQGVVERVVVPS